MDLALVGYGRMGREVERAAPGRGHRVAAVLHPGAADPAARAITRASLAGAAVAIEFTRPGATLANLAALAAAGAGAIVIGTTGWKQDLAEVERLAAAHRLGIVHADNFSLGMALFRRLVAVAARALGARGYEPYVLEWHHKGKRDAPSGTARLLAAAIEAGAPALRRHEGSVAEGLPPGSFQVASVRAGHNPGTHRVGFESEGDTIELQHAAHGRGGFALGALLAAEWLPGRQGVYTFEDVIRSSEQADEEGGRR